MLFAAALLLAAADWTPMRWPSGDPDSLALLRDTPVNCLLIEQPLWSERFAAAARQQHLPLLGVLHPENGTSTMARRAVELGLAGIVLEGDFDERTSANIRDSLAGTSLLVLDLGPRRRIRLDSPGPVVGTYQGVWPGVQAQTGGTTKSAPSGTPWIDTNTGFLRFLRAAVAPPIWIGYKPPENAVVTTERYLQAIADASIIGAHWVVSLDSDLSKRLLQREPKAMATWARIGDTLRFYQGQKEWGPQQAYGQLAIVQDVDSGALLSGGILDMIAVKHTPVRPVASRQLAPESLKGASMTVDVDPASLRPEQKDVLKAFTRGGGTLLNGPPDWRFPAPSDGRITLSDADTKKLDEIWHEVNNMTGRQNLGARLFNVSSMLSSITTAANSKRLVLQLVNYSDYPVESVAVHLLGKHGKVSLYAPNAKPQTLTPYDTEEGIGIDIDKVETSATLVIEE